MTSEVDAPSTEVPSAAAMELVDPLEAARVRAAVWERLNPARDSEGEGGASIGRFRVLDVVGRGAMGVVYLVHDASLDRRVAIKVMHSETSPHFRARLQREAQALARLSHPNVVPVFEVGEDDGRLFIVMEYVAGKTLRQWLQRAERSAGEILDVFVQAGRGLAAAHAAGLVHRDFKPDNAIVGERESESEASGRVRVVDFGLASSGDDASLGATTQPGEGSADLLRATLTTTGALIGTPAYMACEQFRGEPADHRSDQFAFCVSLWEALCRERPFGGATVAELWTRVSDGSIRKPPPGSAMAAWLRPLLERGLAPDPRARWPTLDALLEAIERRRRDRRARVWGLLLASGAIGAGAAWAALRDTSDPCVDAERLAPAWSEERRAELHRTLAAIDVGFASSTADAVDGLLTDYAGRWVAGYREACEATHAEGTQSEPLFRLRAACLADRERGFEGLVRVLADADAEALETAVVRTAALPRIESCADPGYVSAEVAPPDDPSVAAEVDALERDLRRLAALNDADRPDDAIAELRTAVDRARAIDHPPVLVRALNELAHAHYLRGELDTALAVAREGFVASDLASRAAAAENLVEIGHVLESKSEFDEALVHYEKALGITTRALGNEVPEAAMRHNEVGFVRFRQAKYDAAMTSYEEALRIWTLAFGETHPDVARAHNNIGGLLLARGDYAGALARHQLALDVWTRLLGEDHPDVAASHNNIGQVHYTSGRHREALAEFERAHAVLARAVGEDDLRIASVLVNEANASTNLGRHSAARELLERALAIMSRGLGESHADVAYVLNALAATHAKERDWDGALSLLHRAIAIRSAALGTDHPEVAFLHKSVGRNLYLAGRAAEALPELRRAIEIWTRASGPSHPEAVKTRMHLGLALAAANEPEAALAELDAALASWDGGASAGHGPLALGHLARGGVLFAMGDDTRSIEAFAAALDVVADAPADDPELAQAHAGRAITALRAARRDDADAARAELHRLAADRPEGLASVLLALVDAIAELHPGSAPDVARLRAARDRVASFGDWTTARMADAWL